MRVDDLITQLRRDEGEVLHAYQDSFGYLTIGVGRMIDRRRGGGITREESEHLLVNDIRRVVNALDRYIPWWSMLSEERQLVLANMAFNMGTERLVSGWPSTLGAIKRGEYDRAAALMAGSKWARQVGARADRLVAAMRGPEEERA